MKGNGGATTKQIKLISELIGPVVKPCQVTLPGLMISSSNLTEYEMLRERPIIAYDTDTLPRPEEDPTRVEYQVT